MRVLDNLITGKMHNLAHLTGVEFQQGDVANYDACLKAVDGVEFVPMKVSHDAETWRVEVPGLVEGLGGPFRKYMVPENDTCRIYNAPRPEVVPGFLTVGQAKRNIVTGAFGRRWDWSQRSSKHIAFDLRGPKAFTWRQSLQSQ